MGRKIDEEVLIRKLAGIVEQVDADFRTIALDVLAKLANAIMECPTVDAVEVVRCKDCKHLVLTDKGEHNPNDCVCDYWMTDGLNDNDFCYYGERRTDG